MKELLPEAHDILMMKQDDSSEQVGECNAGQVTSKVEEGSGEKELPVGLKVVEGADEVCLKDGDKEKQGLLNVGIIFSCCTY